MKLQAMPGCSVLLVFFLFVCFCFIFKSRFQRAGSPPCVSLRPLPRGTPPVPERPSSHIRHLAGHYICAGLVCSDFFFLFLCLFCSVLVYMLSSGGKSHIMLKFYRVCSKCQVVVRMVYCFGVPLLEKDPCSPPVELVSWWGGREGGPQQT